LKIIIEIEIEFGIESSNRRFRYSVSKAQPPYPPSKGGKQEQPLLIFAFDLNGFPPLEGERR
jgi:hypothetical protein